MPDLPYLSDALRALKHIEKADKEITDLLKKEQSEKAIQKAMVLIDESDFRYNQLAHRMKMWEEHQNNTNRTRFKQEILQNLPKGVIGNLLTADPKNKAQFENLDDNVKALATVHELYDSKFSPKGGWTLPWDVVNGIYRKYQNSGILGSDFPTIKTTTLVANQAFNSPIIRLGAKISFGDSNATLKYKRFIDFPEAEWLAVGAPGTENLDNQEEVEHKYYRLFFNIQLDSYFVDNMSPEGREKYILDSIYEALNIALQKAVINGDGVNQPLGILNTPNIQTLYSGNAAADSTNPNGAAITLEDIENMELAFGDKFNDLSRLGIITNPKVKRVLRAIPAFSGAGVSIWNDLEPFKREVSGVVPDNLSKGTSNDLSAIILGDWRNIEIHFSNKVEILPDYYSKSDKDIVNFTVNTYVSVENHHPNTFVAIKDVQTS